MNKKLDNMELERAQKIQEACDYFGTGELEVRFYIELDDGSEIDIDLE